MKLKRIAYLCVAALCLSGMSACGSTDSSDTTSSADTTAAAEGEDTASAGDGEDTSSSSDSTSYADRVLKVGVKDSVIGFGYKDPLSGEYSGMEVELAKKIADSLGFKDVEFTTVTAATRTELLDSGDLDCVIATFTITDERKKSWDFSTPYYTDAVTVLVETADGITSVDGLVGKKIGVSTGSTSAYNLAKTMSEKGLFGDYTVPEDSSEFDISSFAEGGTTFEQFSDYPSISNAMAAGTVDAFCVDKSILANFKTDDRSYIDDTFAPQEYGVATKLGSELSEPIDELINTWLSDGTIDGYIEEFGLE